MEIIEFIDDYGSRQLIFHIVAGEMFEEQTHKVPYDHLPIYFQDIINDYSHLEGDEDGGTFRAYHYDEMIEYGLDSDEDKLELLKSYLEN